MIIEFLGAPGAGKTRLLHSLIRAEDREVRVVSKMNALRGFLLFSVRHPISVSVWCLILMTRGRSLFRYKTGLMVRAMAARAYAEREEKHRLVYIDEGMVQRMLTVFDEPIPDNFARLLLHLTPLPDVVIAVHGGTFERFTLASNRGNSPRLRYGTEALDRWMRAVRGNFSLMLALLPSLTRVVSCTHGEASAEPDAVRKSLSVR